MSIRNSWITHLASSWWIRHTSSKSWKSPPRVYLISIGWLLCLAFPYGWRFSNKISLDWLLTLATQPSTSKLSDNPTSRSPLQPFLLKTQKELKKCMNLTWAAVKEITCSHDGYFSFSSWHSAFSLPAMDLLIDFVKIVSVIFMFNTTGPYSKEIPGRFLYQRPEVKVDCSWWGNCQVNIWVVG